MRNDNELAVGRDRKYSTMVASGKGLVAVMNWKGWIDRSLQGKRKDIQSLVECDLDGLRFIKFVTFCRRHNIISSHNAFHLTCIILTSLILSQTARDSRAPTYIAPQTERYQPLYLGT